MLELFVELVSLPQQTVALPWHLLPPPPCGLCMLAKKVFHVVGPNPVGWWVTTPMEMEALMVRCLPHVASVSITFENRTPRWQMNSVPEKCCCHQGHGLAY
jgi:hypothetical protein